VQVSNPSIITLDGPSGCGKSTLSRLLALRYQWDLLDSGALYRILAWQTMSHGSVDLAHLSQFFQVHDIRFIPLKDGSQTDIFIDDEPLDEAIIRQPDLGQEASRLAAREDVRLLLVDIQRAYASSQNGLIAEGRDMGSVIFPDATLKVYMTASEAIRNERRFNQLQAMGQSVRIGDLKAKMSQRDARDEQRKYAPLKPAEDAVVVDTSDMPIASVMETVEEAYQKRQTSLT
jgi:CMP/dCMP kinase